jgi:diguanylate cyclase (GGDEF)-like protein
VALCRLLLSKPDMLLLDEPTNHLDAESVAWLERFLHEYPGTVVAVTHDRYFLDNVAGWILELDRGHGIPWEGNYSSWLEQKEQRLELEEKQEAARIKTMKQELEWVRANPKGRHAKSKARLARFEELPIPGVPEARNETNEIYIPPGPRLGDLVIEAKGLRKAYGDNLLYDGPLLQPAQGRHRRHHRAQRRGQDHAVPHPHRPGAAGRRRAARRRHGADRLCGPEPRRLGRHKTVWEEISGGADIITVGATRCPRGPTVGRFNFKGTDQQKRIGDLSGGERNRMHLAKLLKSGGNLLLLDEPTNDLDVETLRALEEALLAFPGCAVVISHDRWFLDRIATHILAFEGDSQVTWFEGNYADYEADRHRRLTGRRAPRSRGWTAPPGRLSEEALGTPLGHLIPALDTPEAALAAPEEDAASPRVRHLNGMRGGESFPLRLLLRDLPLHKATWLLVLAEDLTETERAEAQLDYLERHDPLTGLRNRRDFERAVARTATDPREAGRPHALCLMDLDHFKLINTACGHAAGDKLLKQVARIVATRLADAQVIARLGGDEFAVLFGGDFAPLAQSRCEELVRTLRSFLFTWHERSYDVSVSAGLVTFVPARGVAEVLAQGDIACQTAKSQGGDRLCLYSEDDALSARRQAEATLVSTIGGALDEGRFRMIAQPILPLHDATEPVHYEVLARMRDDQGHPVPPEQFIPAAERYILMPAVDRWILAHVLGRQAEQLRAWNRRYPDRFLFAVNLSATSLTDDGFLPFIRRQFEDNQVPYASICFEVTETAAVSDLGRARSFMAGLRSLGSSFAVDDFGAGFASYAYLKQLPVQYLKIDGSFVRQLETEPMDRALVESINHIGHVLGLETIAEWAETPAVVEALRRMGVDYAQGYGVGRPIALSEVRLERARDIA